MVAPFLNVFLFHRLVAGGRSIRLPEKNQPPPYRRRFMIYQWLGTMIWEPLIYIVYIPINGWELGTMIYHSELLAWCLISAPLRNSPHFSPMERVQHPKSRVWAWCFPLHLRWPEGQPVLGVSPLVSHLESINNLLYISGKNIEFIQCTQGFAADFWGLWNLSLGSLVI